MKKHIAVLTDNLASDGATLQVPDECRTNALVLPSKTLEYNYSRVSMGQTVKNKTLALENNIQPSLNLGQILNAKKISQFLRIAKKKNSK